MPESIPLGKLLGLKLELLPSAILGSMLLWLGTSSAFYFTIHTTLLEAALLGLAAVLLHWSSIVVHHLGHIIAARLIGYPMSGVVFGVFGLLARDVYPENEPELPPAVHIQRGLGGPVASGLLSLFLFLLLPQWSGTGYWLGLLIFLENLIAFTLQVLLPLGFNDGEVVLKNLRRLMNKAA